MTMVSLTIVKEEVMPGREELKAGVEVESEDEA